MKVCELSGVEVIAMQDLVDSSLAPMIGVRCDGRFRGGRCNTVYHFSLS
jgi:hypothetical protein